MDGRGRAPIAVLVDDNVEILNATARYLKSRGVAVITSASAIGVGALVLAHTPTVVVLDVMMPALTGGALARLIRARGVAPPIILYSAMPEEDLYRLAREVPNCSYVLKSDGLELLFEAIKRAAVG